MVNKVSNWQLDEDDMPPPARGYPTKGRVGVIGVNCQFDRLIENV